MSEFKRIPSVANVMTPFPYSIEADQDLLTAENMMRTHGIRHLPVTKGGDLVGIVSARDVIVAQGLDPANDTPQADTTPLSVGGIANPAPHVVDVHDRLDHVALEIAERQLSSALVTKNGRMVGILTTTDICRLLGQFLQQVFPDPEDDDVA